MPYGGQISTLSLQTSVKNLTYNARYNNHDNYSKKVISKAKVNVSTELKIYIFLGATPKSY